jgi:hypothetical protein
MKRKIRRLRLDRQTLRQLTPEGLEQVAGGTGVTDDFGTTRYNSCNFADTHPVGFCLSQILHICP